jgi:hypothetical protein
MGYLQIRHVVDWHETHQYESFAQKYNKYSKLNARDLKTCKLNALKDNNYDQIENFIEYEDFLQNSYFSTLMKFMQYIIEFS